MSFWRYRPKTGEWTVWQCMDTSEADAEERQEDKSGKSSLWLNIGCFGMVIAIGLLLLGLFPAILALLGDQHLPIALLVLGHAPLLVLVIVRTGLNTPDAPEENAKAYFLGYLTEDGLKLDSGDRIPWQKILRYELGWASHTAFRIRLHLTNTRTRPSLGSLSMTTVRIALWLLCPLSAIAALLVAMRLPGHDLALKAAICAVGVHGILALWMIGAIFSGKKDEKTPNKPMELLFDAAQVSVDEVTARLDRHLPPSA